MQFVPKYNITRDEDHNYTIEYDGKSIVVDGTTNILNIVGSKDKTNRLMGWAKKQALAKAADHIREFSGKQLVVNEAWIEEVRKSAWKRDKDKLKEAGDTGTLLHDAIDEDVKGGIPKITKPIEIGFKNYLTWKKNCGIKIVLGDTKVGSLVHKFGGALDGLGDKSGHGLIDYKSSNSIKDEYALQAGGAYCIAAEETFHGLKLDWALVVRFGKEEEGDIEERYVNIENSKLAFLAAINLHNAMRTEVWK